MQIIAKTDAVFLGIKENVGREERKFYEVSLEQNDSVCTLPTSAEVYNLLGDSKALKYKSCVFTLAYDTRFNNLRVVNILLK